MVTIWLGIVPVNVCWILIFMVIVPLFNMMRGDLRAMVREIFGL